MTHDNHYCGTYRAIVVDNNDPEGRGRLKVIVPQLSGKEITDWIEPCAPVEIVDPGDVVFITFEGGDERYPIWMGNSSIQNNNSGVPVGSVTMFAGATVPTGWLLCDGSLISQTKYPRLYSVLGTTYGSQGQLPNFSSKFPRGNTKTASGGSDSHSHADSGHSHTDSGHSHTTVSHTHTDSMGHVHTYSDTTSGPSATVSVVDGTGASHTPANSGHTHTTSGNTGLGSVSITSSAPNTNNASASIGSGSASIGSNSNIPAYVGVQFIIKAV